LLPGTFGLLVANEGTNEETNHAASDAEDEWI